MMAIACGTACTLQRKEGTGLVVTPALHDGLAGHCHGVMLASSVLLIVSNGRV